MKHFIVNTGQIKIHTTASTLEQAIKQVADFKKCPVSICTAEELQQFKILVQFSDHVYAKTKAEALAQYCETISEWVKEPEDLSGNATIEIDEDPYYG